MNPLLEVKNLTSGIKRNNIPIFTSVSFSLKAGDRQVLSGGSGCGKSVLLRSIVFLEPMADGEVCFHSQKVSPDGVPVFRSRVVYMSQKPVLFEGTVEQNLSHFFQFKIHQNEQFDREKAINLLKVFLLEPSFLSKPAKLLSGGESQIIALIRTLMLDPQIILLDEPTASLDPNKSSAFEETLVNWIKNNDQKAFIWVTHNREQEKRIGNRFIELNQGSLIVP